MHSWDLPLNPCPHLLYPSILTLTLGFPMFSLISITPCIRLWRVATHSEFCVAMNCESWRKLKKVKSNLSGLFQPLKATRNRKPHQNRITHSGETTGNKNRLPARYRLSSRVYHAYHAVYYTNQKVQHTFGQLRSKLHFVSHLHFIFLISITGPSSTPSPPHPSVALDAASP